MPKMRDYALDIPGGGVGAVAPSDYFLGVLDLLARFFFAFGSGLVFARGY